MKKYVIVFTSPKGQTQAIAQKMKEVIEKEEVGSSVDLVNITSKHQKYSFSPDTEKIIIGAPVYMGKYPRVLTSWLKNHRDEIISKKTGFFSVSLNAADKRPEARTEDNELIKTFFSTVGFVSDFVATLEGSLNYPAYGWLVKKIMASKSASANGPLDVSKNHVLTNWDKVSAYTLALIKGSEDPLYSTTNRLKEEKAMYSFMPVFEQTWSLQKTINKSPDEVFQALMNTKAREMTLANILGWIRSFGKENIPPKEITMMESAEKFGSIELFHGSRELIAGLVGRFWQPQFGIKKLFPNAFRDFNEPGFTKVITHFKVEQDQASDQCTLIGEMRIHSTDESAAKKFKAYWSLLNPGIKLYMRSMLSAVQKEAIKS